MATLYKRFLATCAADRDCGERGGGVVDEEEEEEAAAAPPSASSSPSRGSSMTDLICGATKKKDK